MKSSLIALSLALTLAMAACTSLPAIPGQDGPQAQAPVLTPRARAQLAVEFLDAGQEKQAMAQIDALLADNPADPVAIKLQRQVQGDPQKMLGASYTTYTVKGGDSISSLAKTHLGDAMLFYALSRYNQLPAPNRLMVGQTLKLPDQYAGGSKGTVVAATAPKPVEPTRTISARDAESAKALRLEALEHLNKGNADLAVTLLAKAGQLDSGNSSIPADLARAQRIQQALRTE